MTVSTSGTPAHIDVPLAEDEPGIEVANRQPAHWRIEVDFTPEEVKRLRAGLPGDGRVTRFIKQAALERADAEARRIASDELREAD